MVIEGMLQSLKQFTKSDTAVVQQKLLSRS